MKVTLGKGTNEFCFMGDFYKLMSDFWTPDNNGHYFERLISASDDLLNKYKDCDFYLFAKALVLVFNVYVSDVKFKGKKKGCWVISFRGD